MSHCKITNFNHTCSTKPNLQKQLTYISQLPLPPTHTPPPFPYPTTHWFELLRQNQTTPPQKSKHNWRNKSIFLFRTEAKECVDACAQRNTNNQKGSCKAHLSHTAINFFHFIFTSQWKEQAHHSTTIQHVLLPMLLCVYSFGVFLFLSVAFINISFPPAARSVTQISPAKTKSRLKQRPREPGKYYINTDSSLVPSPVSFPSRTQAPFLAHKVASNKVVGLLSEPSRSQKPAAVVVRACRADTLSTHM